MLVDDEEKLRQFNSEWDQQYSTDETKPPLEVGKSGTTNLLDSVHGANTIAPATGQFVPAAIPTTGDSCSQCGLLHPPVRPGDVCPNATPAGETAQPTPAPAPAPAQAVPEKVVDAVIDTNPPPTMNEVKRIVQEQKQNTEIVSEPPALADNNIPTEIHVNKYLAAWGDQIQAHCNTHALVNIKKLMRHLTIEITDFLESYKGK